MEQYRQEIEKEAIKRYGNDIHLFAQQRDGFKEAFNSAISQRIRLDFAISVLEEVQKSLFDYHSTMTIKNKINELKKQIDEHNTDNR